MIWTLCDLRFKPQSGIHYTKELIQYMSKTQERQQPIVHFTVNGSRNCRLFFLYIKQTILSGMSSISHEYKFLRGLKRLNYNSTKSTKQMKSEWLNYAGMLRVEKCPSVQWDAGPFSPIRGLHHRPTFSSLAKPSSSSSSSSCFSALPMHTLNLLYSYQEM